MNSRFCLEHLRPCLEGEIPTALATCGADGTPNVTYVSQVHYVDHEHVALTFQFFNKTRENILANPQATAYVIHPETGARFRLALLYRRTETEGPLFESMKAKLAGLASQTGMAGVFKLQGSDVYQVLDVEHVPGRELPPSRFSRNRLAGLRRLSARIAACTDLATLLEQALESLERDFDIRHAMVLFADSHARKLYTVATRGYAQSGIGSEFPIGRGIIGVAAEVRTPIRILFMASEYAYSQAIREHMAEAGMADKLETEIPFPGLPSPHSQLAVPIVAAGRLLGVLHVESPEPHRFSYDDEDALVSVATLLGEATLSLQAAAECSADEARSDAAVAPVPGAALAVKYYAANHSVFLGEDYLIKGVAGAIFWRLLQLHEEEGRTEFTNRELRLDPALKLPDIDDNLEARLILLQRRLAERQGFIAIEKTGRGRFRLQVKRPLLRQEMPGR
ncbi:MAG: signal transduction protein containing and PtsI domain [Moraxellaceae bacterium]|nr:signal transduction protein containing and PtsI domain [Moraxellaceae bacterium]